MGEVVKFVSRSNRPGHKHRHLFTLAAVVVGATSGNFLFDYKQDLMHLVHQSSEAVAAVLPQRVMEKVASQAPRLTFGCNIKGNISIRTGEKIYHVPGQKYYAVTRISPHYGERYFCSEQEARAAGWRKSRI